MAEAWRSLPGAGFGHGKASTKQDTCRPGEGTGAAAGGCGLHGGLNWDEVEVEANREGLTHPSQGTQDPPAARAAYATAEVARRWHTCYSAVCYHIKL